MENKRNKESEINCGSISAEKLRVDYERRLQPVKPVTVRLDDFKKNLNRVVADSELPPFLLELVLGEMLSAMSRVAETEREQDREAWEKTCAELEYEHNKESKGKTCKGGEVNG
ncbi:hypothetical protein D3Z62_31180 [Lachnospiraceae bacterium]|nr:hypothetical protein [Lachnospiraceae bacterium]